MKLIVFLVFGLLLFERGSALICYNCYVEGPQSAMIMELQDPKGPIWEECSGSDEDMMVCDGVCIQIKLSGNDTSKYEILRSCAYSEEICSELEFPPEEVQILDCVSCKTDKCNDDLS